MTNNHRFFRFIDAGNDYELNELICQFVADDDADAKAEFIRRTGYDPDECPRVQGMSFEFGGRVHRELTGEHLENESIPAPVWQG